LQQTMVYRHWEGEQRKEFAPFFPRVYSSMLG
jgi:hypothetical protein